MKKLTYITLLATISMFSQVEVDMTKELSNMNGHTTIDGNQIQADLNTKEQIIIVGKDMVLNEGSSFMFNNVIVKLFGEIFVKGTVKPTIVDSYILCKKSNKLRSKNILEIKKDKKVQLSKVKFIKNIKKNPVIMIYDMTGKRVLKGNKKDLLTTILPVSMYDVKVQGNSFNEKILFIEL